MTDATAPSADVAASPASRSRTAPVLLLLTLLTTTGTAGWLWWEQTQRQTSPPPAAEPVAAAVTAPIQAVPRAEFDALVTRLDDLQRVNKVQQQQVLALTDRVRVLSERLDLHGRTHAGSGNRNAVNPSSWAIAEQWLHLAQARLELFADPAGALQALDAADRALLASTDPRVPALRQTLDIERNALRSSPILETVRVAAQLESWQQALDTWPARPEAQPAAEPGATARVLGRLDRYFRVRPIAATGSSDLPAAQAVIAAELGWARVLLARGERAALQLSLQRCVAGIEQQFDPDDPGVQAALAGLQELLNAIPGSGSAPRLGATLLELSALQDRPAPRVDLPIQAESTDSAPQDHPEQPPEPASLPAPGSVPAEVPPVDPAEPEPGRTPEPATPPAPESVQTIVPPAVGAR